MSLRERGDCNATPEMNMTVRSGAFSKATHSFLDDDLISVVEN